MRLDVSTVLIGWLMCNKSSQTARCQMLLLKQPCNKKTHTKKHACVKHALLLVKHRIASLCWHGMLKKKKKKKKRKKRAVPQ